VAIAAESPSPEKAIPEALRDQSQESGLLPPDGVYGIKEASKRETTMPKVCEICQKGPVFGHNVSHSHKSSPKKWKPNLQSVKAQTAKGPKKIWVCTRCLRSGKVVKAV
jgi:large subunit ribosomal protein L28